MSKIQPYSPLHKPQKPVSQDRMQEILSKNSSKATQSPQEKFSLKWLPPERTGPGTAMMRSECGQFRIDKVESQLSVGYTCWRLRAADRGLNQRLGSAGTKEEAIALCESQL